MNLKTSSPSVSVCLEFSLPPVILITLLNPSTYCCLLIFSNNSHLYLVQLVCVSPPTLQSIGDDSVGLFAFGPCSADAAVTLDVQARDGPPSSTTSSSSIWVQRGVGRGQEAGWVWVACPRVVEVAVAPEAVCVCLPRRSVPSSVLCCLCGHVVPGATGAGAAVTGRQQLPLHEQRKEELRRKSKRKLTILLLVPDGNLH